ncbi:hypothetical protein BH23GEM6_BH23GEM6_18520 [soil metagenome]
MNAILSASVLEILLGLLFIGFVISGLDDLFVDGVYWVRRLAGGRPFKPIRVSQLESVAEGRAAIFLPAWMEAEVIEQMLLYNAGVVQYSNYTYFIGTYPNDVATQERVDAAMRYLPNVVKSVAPKPGPTTKADNLNAMLATMEAHERETGERYRFMLLHDAEDMLHPYELKLLNYHLAKGEVDMIQLPIYPVPVQAAQVTGGTYMDQFAEVHTKDMHVRQWIGGFVPSSGVATALTRRALDALKEEGDGIAFRPDHLTEDYDMGLKLALAGHRAMFLRQEVVQDTGSAANGAPLKQRYDRLVATRSEFPHQFRAAVRQRTRWMLGIVFQSWKFSGWQGGLVNRWLLFHDRKPVWTYPLLAVGYLLLLFVLGHTILRNTLMPELNVLLNTDSWVTSAFWITTIFLVNRLLQRAIAVFRIFGPAQAVFSIVRQPWDNVITLFAMTRAANQFIRSELSGKRLGWDKTTHAIPVLVQHRLRLGEILIAQGLITQEQLGDALATQVREGRRVGEILVEQGLATEEQVEQALAMQSAMPIAKAA